MRRVRVRRAVMALGGLVLLVGLVLGSVLLGIRSQTRTGFRFFADVFVWHPDGRVEQASPGAGIYYQPCIRPDGREVVFAGGGAGAPRIWALDLVGGQRRALTPPDFAALQPTYSWDGARIAFTSDRAEVEAGRPPTPAALLRRGGTPRSEQRFHLWVMDADGSAPRRITRGEHSDWRPAFSPDGERLVFFSDRSGVHSLWTVALEGPGEPEPVPGTDWTGRPWYGADGRTIYCHTVGPQPHRAQRVPAEGGAMVPLENDVFEVTHGSFVDPGGASVLVHARKDGSWGIWELPLDGGPARSLQPPGFQGATHATRSRNGVLAFDLARDVDPWSEALRRLVP